MGASFGEARVRLTFNPSSNKKVDDLKKLGARFIDACNDALVETENSEARRCFALAMTNAETAAMYAVKGATTE